MASFTVPDPSDTATRNRGGRPPVYPWNDWLDGGQRRLRRGDDFFCPNEHFVCWGRRVARRRGLRLRSRTIDPRTIVIWAEPRPA